MTTGSWTHRLEEWSHPRPASAMATVGLVILAMGIVLFAIGGAALSQDPAAFDLWVVAIGLYLLAGAIVGIGRSPERGSRLDRLRSYADPPSLAEGPILSGNPADPSFASRRQTPSARSWGASDTIAGQYAEASRIRAGRSASRRLSPLESDLPIGSGYPYAGDPVRRGPSEYSTGPSRAMLENEVEQLRARVAELESGRAVRAGPPASPDANQWPGPSLCVGCGSILVGGPDDARCVRCGRPLCARCFVTVADGPEAHQCPECRGRIDGSAPIRTPIPVTPALEATRTG
ncbi:MAG: 60S ribosomal export protein NMD3 [Thermoplasmata archaeon]|nr:60S ribosomal export protein NMD3 [Thermoplasmata archaeon]MCI4359561.1 60S ribosomal export protein NMD3 [Thermoplasmata archaeon]